MENTQANGTLTEAEENALLNDPTAGTHVNDKRWQMMICRPSFIEKMNAQFELQKSQPGGIQNKKLYMGILLEQLADMTVEQQAVIDIQAERLLTAEQGWQASEEKLGSNLGRLWQWVAIGGIFAAMLLFFWGWTQRKKWLEYA